MELTNSKIANSVQLLNLVADAGLPPASSIRMSRNLNELQEQQQTIQEARQEIVERYQAEEDGEPLYRPAEHQARQDAISEKAEEEGVDEEDVDPSDVEVDLPDGVPRDHEYATQQPYIPDEATEDLSEDLAEMLNDSVEVDISTIPADEISAFADAFYEAAEDSDQVNVEGSKDGMRPGDIAPISFLFPADL